MPTADALARAESRAREARERALREGNAGRPAAGVRHARAGLRHLGWNEARASSRTRGRWPRRTAPLAARLLGLVGQWEAELGRTGYGLSLLDRAEKLAAAGDRGVLLGQRGTVYLRTGREQDAVAVLGEAVAQLAGKPAETVNLARTPAESQLRLPQPGPGEPGPGRPGLVPPHRRRRGATTCIAAKALHNLGYCDLLAGDIPAALQLLRRGRRGVPAERARFPARAGDRQGQRAARGRAGQRRRPRARRGDGLRPGGSGSA